MKKHLQNKANCVNRVDWKHVFYLLILLTISSEAKHKNVLFSEDWNLEGGDIQMILLQIEHHLFAGCAASIQYMLSLVIRSK